MIQGAAVGIVPNRRDAATEYMLPVKLLEYVYLGIPVIAPAAAGHPVLLCRNQVAYYEPGNLDELRGLHSPAIPESLRKGIALRRKSAEFAQNRFSWETLKEELFKVVDANRRNGHAKLDSNAELRIRAKGFKGWR